MTKITIREGTNGTLQDGEKPFLREVDAIVCGDYATYYHPLMDSYSITHVPTGYAACFVENKPFALAVLEGIRGIHISATYDDEHGFRWPNEKQESRRLMGKLHELGIQAYRPEVTP